MGSRTVCFIDKETGISGTCGLECMDKKQLISLLGTDIISCEKCFFYRKYVGKESEYFSYTAWTGDFAIKKKNMNDINEFMRKNSVSRGREST